MPPCRSVLECKIDRANYLSVLIKNCNNNMIQFTDPGLHGWAKSGNKYKIQFYACPQFPDFLGANEIFQNDKDESDTEDEVRQTDVFKKPIKLLYNFRLLGNRKRTMMTMILSYD